MWESTVTWVGISLCAVIVLATLLFVCHHRYRQQQKRHKRGAGAGTGAVGGEALLINGELPNSPSHSGNSGGDPGSKNISFGSPAGSPIKNGATPLGSPTKRDYVMPRGTNGIHSPVDISIDKQKAIGASGGHSRRSSHSSVTVAPPAVHSPYLANAGVGDYKHNPQLFNVSPAASESPRRQRKKQRHRSGSPGKRVGSPGAGGAPIANCDEDLSPISPVHSSRSPIHGPHAAHGAQSPMGPISEHIPLENYLPHHPHRHPGANVRSPPGSRRPPVEGRDSLTRHRPPTTPDRQNANYLPGSNHNLPGSHSNTNTRPDIKPLPLRDVQRPDGQSPENRPHDPNANTPSSLSSLSPILNPTKLFPTGRSPSMDIALDGEMEYDDYIPDLPGSYFTMDPHAYTLTWSQQQPWGAGGNGSPSRGSNKNNGHELTTRVDSQSSLGNNDRHQTSNC